LKKIKKADIWQFLRFCIVGTSNAVIDFLVLNVLLWASPTANTWRVLSYNSLAVLLAATNSFFWNKYWTFQQRHPVTRQEVFRFAIVAGGTILMNNALMGFLSELFPGLLRSTFIGANVLKLSAIIGTMSISFFGMRLWVFFQQRYASPSAGLALVRLLTEQETVKISAVPVFSRTGTAQLKEDQRRPAVAYASKIHSISPWRQEEELSSVASKSISLEQAQLSTIRPVKLLPL
jgi:putative flippase GtrA